MCNYFGGLGYIAYTEENLLICIAVAAVVILVVGEILYYQSLKYKTKPEIAIVTGTDYKKAYSITRMTKIGKIVVPQTIHYPEDFLVYAEYNGKIYCIHNEELFNEVDVGEKIRVWVHEGYNKRGKLEDVYLSSRE